MDTLLAAARSTESSGSGSEEPSAPGGKPEQKRKKVSLACARCKKRKGKCDGVTPACGPCSRVGATCEWPDATSDGRKRRKGSALHYQLQQAAAAQQATTEGSQMDELEEDDGAPPQPTPTFVLPPTPAVSLPPPAAALHPNPFPPTPLAAIVSPPPPPLVAQSVEMPFAEAASTNDTVPFLNYYRPFGPTALKSGVEEIRIDIAAAPTFSRAVSPTGFAPSAPDSFASSSTSTFASANQHTYTKRDSDRFYDVDSDMPREEILDHLYPIFFSRMGSLFPSLSLPFLESLNSSNSFSQHSLEGPVLASAVCALAARFSTSPLIRGNDEERPPACYGVPFAEKAKALLLPLLCFPSGITITTLLLLSYHEKGMNSEGSQWMYLGMSIRMAQDLGLQLSIVRLPHNQYECSTASLLWWSIMNLDHQLSLGIGRCTTVKAAETSLPYPTDDDIAIARRGPHGGFAFVPSSLPSPFPAYVKLMALVGQLCDIVNLTKGTWGGKRTSQRQEDENEYAEKGPSLADPPMDEVADPTKTLKDVEDKMTELYSSLAPQLQWSSQNFREHMSAGTGPIYLHVHLWYHAAFIMMYRPPLLYPNCYAANLTLTERLSVVSNSASTISQILSCCDMSDENPIIACPFINLPFYVAGQAWSQDWRIRTGKKVLSTSTPASTAAGGPASSSSSRILAQVALTNFELCKSALKKQSDYWLGIRWVQAVLEKASSRQSIMSATEGINTFVSRHELAIFKRLAQRISGQAQTPEFDTQYLSTLFHTLQETDLTSMDYNLSQDDYALAYTFAGSFPESVDFGGLPGLEGL